MINAKGTEADIENKDPMSGEADKLSMKDFLADYQLQMREKKIHKKMIPLLIVCLLLSLVANFGLTCVVTTLNAKVNTAHGDFVDAHTGKRLAIKPHGNNIELSVNPDYARRRLLLEGSLAASTISGTTEDSHEGLRRLNEEVEAFSIDGVDHAEAYDDFKQGSPTSFEVEFNGVTYQATLVSGSHYDDNGCAVYDNVKVTGIDTADRYTFKGVCCGDEECNIYVKSSSRRLAQYTRDELLTLGNGVCANDVRNGQIYVLNNKLRYGDSCSEDCMIATQCFSAVSTVVEKDRGQMLLKDLKRGDQVLTADGSYKPFTTMLHMKSEKLANFIQIFTDETKEAPLELTGDHWLFLHGEPIPVEAKTVKIGDMLVGVHGVKKVVTDIKEVTRKGAFAPLTGDGSIVVDGVVASCFSSLNGKTGIQFAGYDIHAQTIFEKVFNPHGGTNLGHWYCEHVNSYLCDTHVDDGEGGFKSVVLVAVKEFSSCKSIFVQFLVLLAVPIFLLTSILAMCIARLTVFALLIKVIADMAFPSLEVKFDGAKKQKTKVI